MRTKPRIGDLAYKFLGTSVLFGLLSMISCTSSSVGLQFSYTVSGTVSGLAGSGLVLQENGGNNLAVSANGSFTFTNELAAGTTYNVTVFTQPINPSQTCVPTLNTGTGTSNISNVLVTCTTNTFAVGGTVSGLAGSGLVLQDNGGDNLSVAANGPFTFTTALSSGTAYSVTVFSQPTNPNQTCIVTSASGTETDSNATSVSVACATTGGTPTFTTFDAPGAGITPDLGTRPQEINEGGDIVGYFYDSKGIVHGFVRNSAGAFSVFDAPGSTTTKCCLGTFAQSINNSGTVAGYFVDDSLSLHGFVRTQSGTFTVFDVAGSPGTNPSSINDGGIITGTIFSDTNQHLRGFVLAADGSFKTFDAPAVIGTGQFVGTVPAKVNAGGLVVGYFLDTNQIVRGFTRAVDGTITTFVAPGVAAPCTCGTQPTDINTNGAVVGFTFAAGVTKGFLRGADGTFTLFAPPNAVTSGTGSGALDAVAINDSGEIVGNYRDVNGILHGFLRKSDGNFTILDDPNSLMNGSFGTGTTYLNANGAIIGFYGDAFGTVHGYLWQ